MNSYALQLCISHNYLKLRIICKFGCVNITKSAFQQLSRLVYTQAGSVTVTSLDT
jgi:hypothetical protein